MKAFDAAATAAGRGVQSATARLGAAGLLLANNQPAAALAEARRAFDDANGIGAQPIQALSLIGIAEARLGRAAESAKAGENLVRQTKQLPGPLLRQIEYLHAGTVALERHEAAKAVEQLKQADRLIPPGPSGATIFWFPMGEAFLAAKDDAAAAGRFQHVVEGRGRLNRRSGDRVIGDRSGDRRFQSPLTRSPIPRFFYFRSGTFSAPSSVTMS